MSFIELTGHAKLDRWTKNLVKRLSPDDIAIIDHTDLDRVSAEELLESGVRVVVNVAPSQSGRYPNPGPLALVRGGVRLIDVSEADLFERVHEGELLTVRGAGLYRNGTCVASGRILDERQLEGVLAEQRGRVTEALEAFAENTMRYLREEGKLLAEGIDFPALTTRFRDRHALVVARGPGYKRDLRIVKPYIRDFKPVLVGVDGGADALLEAGYKPDVIVGDMDSVSDRALRSARELVVHAYPDGRAPGAARAERAGPPTHVVPALGVSEDVALLLAYEKGAELIVAVGTHLDLKEFLERNRAGMSSTFVARLKVGDILVDAKGVSRLVSDRAGVWPLVAFALAGLAAIVAFIVVQRSGFFQTVFEARTQTGGSSTRTHLEFYSLIRPALAEHAFFGLGLNTFEVYYEFLTGRTNYGPHSYYVALLTETGIVGTALYAVWLGYLFSRLRALASLGRALARAGERLAARVRPLAWGFAAALLGTMAANVFYLTMQMYYFFVLAFLVLAAPVVFGRAANGVPEQARR